MDRSQHFQHQVLNTTIKAPAVSIEEAAKNKSTGTHTANFERKPGLLARLTRRFEQLKTTMTEARAKAAMALPKPGKLMDRLDSFMANIKLNLADRQSPGRSQRTSASSYDHMLTKPQVDRHARVLAAFKRESDSLFNQLDAQQKTQFLAALDACTKLSGETAVSPEGLFLLQEGIDLMSEATSDGKPHATSADRKLVSDLAWIRMDCAARLANFYAQSASGNSSALHSVKAVDTTTGNAGGNAGINEGS